MASEADRRSRLQAFNQQQADAKADRDKHREGCLRSAFQSGLTAGAAVCGLASSAMLLNPRLGGTQSMRAFGVVFTFFLPFCLSA